jgi:hypothetical protein
MMQEHRKELENSKNSKFPIFCHRRSMLTIRGAIMGRVEVVWNVAHLRGFHRLQH